MQKPVNSFKALSALLYSFKTVCTLISLVSLLAMSAHAQTTPTIDLSVTKKVSNQNPALGDILSYTVIVKNEPGSATATNVVIKDQLPVGGVSYVPSSASTLRGTGTYASATGLWSLSAIAPGDSAILTLNATVLERGVWFNTAEVMSADQTDSDSQPNNQSLVEDDYAAVCFSVPIYWYPGDEFTVSVPTGYENIVWYRNNQDVTTLSADSAVVNADSSLTIKSPGTYRFTMTLNGCPALNCCDIQVVQGPYGSLGDYVWLDTNKNGLQDDGSTGIDGVKVYLYDATGAVKLDSTVTAGGGKYLFDSLTDGSYKIKFIAPTNFTLTQQDVASTPTDSLDSDVGSDGFTRIYTIDTSKPANDTARNNPNVDAGFIQLFASLGDFVWVDNNKDGIQDSGEPGIPNVVVVLLDGNNTPIASTTTDNSGIYSFTGLTPGIPYSVSFVAPASFTATIADAGGSDAFDSDANPITGQTQSVTLAPGENNLTLDAGFYPVTPTTDLAIVKTGPSSVTAGQSLSYNVVITNNGPSGADGATVSDPAVANFTATTVSCLGSGGGAACPTTPTIASLQGGSLVIPTLPSGGSLTLVVTGTAGASGTIVNVASVAPPSGVIDTNPNNDSSTAVTPITPVTPTTDLAIVKTGPSSVTAGQSLSYNVVITNNGPSGADGATVSDPAVANFTATTVSCLGSGGGAACPTTPTIASLQGGSLVIPTLPSGGSLTLVVTGTAGASGTIVNVASVAPPSGVIDTNPNNDSSTAVTPITPVTPTTDLAIVKTGPSSVTAGQSLSYNVVITNNGPSGADGATVSDPAVANFTATTVSCLGSGGGAACPTTPTIASLQGGSLVIPTLPSGGSLTLVVTGTAGASGTIVNVASVAPPSGVIDTNPNNDSSTAVTPITPVTPTTDLAIVKTGPSSVTAGQSLSYNVVITNNGPSGADGATVSDPAVANFTATTVSCLGSGGGAACPTTPTIASLQGGSLVIPTLPSGGSLTLVVTGTAGASGTIVNVASVAPPSGVVDTNPNNDSSTAVTPINSCPADFCLATSNNASICKGDSVDITASSCLPNVKICWFLTPDDEIPFAIVENGQLLKVKPGQTTTYYVEASIEGSAEECHSERKQVVITVNSVDTPVIASTLKNTCPAQTADLTTVAITNNDPLLTYEWYTSTNRSQATMVTNLTAVGAGQYYLFARSAQACYSNPAILTVEIVNCSCQNLAEVQVGSGLTTCSVDPVTLQATISGSATSVTWTSTGTGTFSAPSSLTTTYTPSLADVSSGTVVLTATTNDPDGPGGVCNASSSSLILKINKRPDAPVGVACDDTLVCQGGATKLIGFAPGSKINWYDENGQLLMTTESGGKLTIKPSKSGANIYYAEAVSADNCTSSSRTSVTVTVGTCLADLAVVKQIVTAGPYSVGQKITYSITVSNNGPITATDVQVSDVLPSTLTFNSATPSSEYSAATGIWTIGTLTQGSNRNLFVEATINATGSIKNTAIVSGSNNDPNYPQNDTSSVVIPVEQCNVQPPYIACAITDMCKGDVATLKATGCDGGTIKWSDGQTGFSVTVKPTLTTTYTASCVSGSCTSAASNSVTITVHDPQPPTIVASSATVCPGASVTLTASGCTGGTIEWSEGAQTGASIVVNPYSKTTYTAQCRVGSCLSGPATKTIDVSSGLPTPTIATSATSVCPGGSITLTVNNCVGTPHWSSTTATTSSIVVIPTQGNNSYSVYCANGSCSSQASPTLTIPIITPAIPTISADVDSVCANAPVVLTAYGCDGGTIVWNNGMTGASITVNPAASTSYYAQCKTSQNCLSDPSTSVDITVVSPSAPIVKADKSLICSGEVVSLTATGCNGTVLWPGTDKTGAVIQILPGETKEYYATCKVGNCVSDASNKVRITVTTSGGAAPTITASSLAVCSNSVVSLTATGCSGTVLWSDGQTGAVVSVTATPENKTFYAVCRPTNSTLCASGRSNIISIDVTPTPRPTIVRCVCSSDTICPGESVKLDVKNCQGTPYWSTQETTSSIVVAPGVTTTYTVYCKDGVCQSEVSAGYTVTVVPVGAPTIVASATSVEPGGTVSLSATGCSGDVIWSANDINGNNKGSVLVVQPDGIQTYYAQCKFRDCLSDPSNTITINKGDCVAKAGTLVAINPAICIGSSTTATIGATPNGGLVQPNGYSVLYVLTKGAGMLVDQTSATPNFVVAAQAGQYQIHTLVYNANPADANYLDLSLIKSGITSATDVLKLIADEHVCADWDLTGAAITLQTIPAPGISGNSSLTVCYGSTVSLTATGCESGTVTWSDGSVGQTISKIIYNDLSLTASCWMDGCTSGASTPVAIHLSSPAIPAIVVDKPAICTSETVSLTATGCVGGTYVWSDPTSTTGSVLTVSPTQTVQYRVKCVIGACESEWSAYNTITVGAPAAPTIAVSGGGNSTTVCFGTPVTLVAEGCSDNSYVTWSNNQVGQSITVSLASSTTITAQCCTSTQCKSAASNGVAVTVLPKVAQPLVVDKTNSCPFTTVDLSTAVTSAVSTAGGVFEYYNDAVLSTKVANPSAVGTGTYYVVERTSAGCVSLPVAIHVQITTCEEQSPCDAQNPATADAGADASICASKSYQVHGTMGGAGKVAYWKSSGNGTFDNPYALNATYTASAEDILAGKVTLTLSVSTNNASCPVATDDMVLTIQGGKTTPVVTIQGNINLCYGDSVTLKAPDGASGYVWSNNAHSQSIVVKQSGSYSVQLLDGNGCSSVKSDAVAVNVADPVLPPLVSNLRNSCPSKIVDLTKAISSPDPSNSYIYRICECNTSNIVIRPDSVCEGTYWIVAKGPTGCLSAPAKVVVKVFNCASDTLDTDVSIAKTADKSVVKRGETVTYTLTVSNNGPHTAHNIDVRDVLPKELDVVNLSSDLTITNGVLKAHIDSLPAGKTKSIVFGARLLTRGEVVNTAEITYLDNKDTNLSNNTSSVTVKDTSTAKAGVIGLAKAVVGTPAAVGDSLIKVRYSFVVTNMGDDTLSHVQLTDDLAYAFSPNAVQDVTISSTNADFSLNQNPAFTGMGGNTQLFDSTSSYIAPNSSQTFFLDVTVKRTNGDTTKTFRNIASVSAWSNGMKVEDLSINGGDVDPDGDGDPTNNTGFSTFTLGEDAPTGPSLGVALAVVSVQLQADSSYNVTYKATVKNYGDVALYGLSLTDSLVNAFAAPTSFSVVGAPVVGAGSHLVANAGFDGNTDANLLQSGSYLNIGEQDTVLITVNVKPNGQMGPFYSTVVGQGRTADSTQTVMDISNNGLDPQPEGAVATGVRFDLPSALLGVAKSVGVPTMVETGVYDIPYTIKLSNLGTVPLTKVQVVDNLSETFGHGALIVSNRVPVTADADLAVDTLYTGQGMITNMLVDSMSTLPVGATRSLNFTVRVDVKNADSLTFYNTAYATALADGNVMVADTSTAGTNNDPDNDLDPRNNSEPTPISLNNLTGASYIGVAMAVSDTARQPNGSYNVTYKIVVQNFGPEDLKMVIVSDSLSKVFNNQTGATYSVVQAPTTTSTGSSLVINNNFDGDTQPLIVLGDSTSILPAGQTDTLQLVINVASNGSTTTFLNSVYAQARASTGIVSDVSTNGLIPDLNGNLNPTDLNEREATPLNLPVSNQTVFIPEGFSPNGDGINDTFVIRGLAGVTVSLEVYNRWGSLVYKNDDYKNDWNGKANTGVMAGSDADGLPDGTYYYVIRTSDGRRFVRYMTINR
ncbi:SdrD B-like domain-containing protein [Spirosoma sp. SC4-14]|uniref:SdrD B-like domain-containing protein n=1 Tax=Spirosoma sp. SC4-14 TaxID=3128900 RepID=UPI0030CC3344